MNARDVAWLLYAANLTTRGVTVSEEALEVAEMDFKAGWDARDMEPPF